MAHRLFRHPLSGIPLRWVLVVPFVLQTVGAVALVGYLSYRSGQQTVENLANRLMEETGNLVVHQLNENLEFAKLANRTNASAIRAGYIDGFNLKTVEPHYVEQLRLMPTLSALGLINEKREFLAVERPQPDSLILRRFKPTGTDWGLYRYFADQNGKNLALQDIRRNYDSHNDPPGNPWYEKARRSPDGTWRLVVTLAMGQDTPMLQLIHALPFNNARGQFSGVLAASVYLTQLGDFLKNLQISKTGQVFLIEPDGLLVATSTGEVPFDQQRRPNHAQNVAVKHRRLSSLQSQNPLTRAAATYLLTSRGQATGQVPLNQSQSASFWFNHQRYFVRTVPLAGELNWLAIVVVPESNFTGALEVNNGKTAFLSWLTLFVATGLGILTSRWISKPILRLSQASRALAQGEWQQSLKEDSPITELKTLNTSFNQTAEQLQRSLDLTRLALYESQDKFAKIFRTSPDAVNIVSMEDGTYVEVNEQFVQITGYSREEVIGHTALELNLLADPEQALQLGEMLQTGQPIRNLEIKLRTRAGQFKTGLMSSELLDLEGQRCVLSIFKDVSDRKQAEQALRDSEARFQKIADAAPGEIYILLQHPDGSYEFEYMSPACRDIQELEPEQILRYPELSFEQVHPDDRAGMYTCAAESAATLQPFSHEWRLITPSGLVKWVQVSARPERRQNGDIAWYGVLQDISDRKQVEAALRQSEEHFQKLAAASPGVIYTVVEYPDGPVRYEYLSPAFEEIHEVPVADVLQDATITLQQIHPDDRAGYQQAVAESLAAMQPFKHEWRIITPSGKTKWIQASSRPERRENGEIAWHGVVVDVTDRKQAEAKLEQAIQQIDTHFENSPLAIVQWDQHYRVLRWSKQAERIFGWTAAEVIHQSWLDWNFVYEADLEYVNTSIAPLLNGAVSNISIQNRNYTKEGRVITCQWYTSAVFDETGNLLSMLSFAQDISDRLRAELELTKAHDLREAIFNEATDAIFLVEAPPNQLILDCNQCAVEMFEVECKQDLIGIEGNTLQKTQFTAEELAAIGAELMQKGYWSREIEYVTKQGRIFWGSMAAKPIQIGDQMLQLVRLTDISDRHELDRIKDEFISIVSHELRTPLTAIRGSLGILETGILNEEPDTVHHMLQVAVRNSERLVRLVNDILDLERLESGKVQLVMEPCWVSDLMEMALEGMQAIAAEADITLHSSPIHAQVCAAPDAIVQALTNLLGNAIKFSSPGGMVWLKAEIGNGERQEDLTQNSKLKTQNSFPPPPCLLSTPYLLFSIKDQGRGIPADKLDNIFGRFQQVDVSDARQKGGTGLGLAICKSIIQQHGGQIWAESVLGQGSTFYFTLPLQQDQEGKGESGIGNPDHNDE
ncbi:PAS domain S-box protein [Leptodesmis sichuanensis]|uniref:PAS domain S-box protein n=1 Tax=Leptodesmis sichuanensis TaxID=2906798 RepID=UPI001F29E0D4|nr:PAS domain S-box protein [Leptodesmis sichuanensis]UIE38318.1 PAS domain S-box protein [Leptodesmis sichuanensis A121]